MSRNGTKKKIKHILIQLDKQFRQICFGIHDKQLENGEKNQCKSKEFVTCIYIYVNGNCNKCNIRIGTFKFFCKEFFFRAFRFDYFFFISSERTILIFHCIGKNLPQVKSLWVLQKPKWRKFYTQSPIEIHFFFCFGVMQPKQWGTKEKPKRKYGTRVRQVLFTAFYPVYIQRRGFRMKRENVENKAAKR